MCEYVILEWSFTPANYFEEAVEILCHNCAMNITEGKVETKIEPSIFDSNSSIRQELHDCLNGYFLGAQLHIHRPYELCQSATIRVSPDGRRQVTVDVGSTCGVTSRSDFVCMDKDGNIFDSRLDRIEKTKKLAEFASAHRTSDPLVNKMLLSYNAAVRDPGNELLYLYEIRDALHVRFGGASAAKSALSITEDWSRLGILCNKPNFRQGRHRGRANQIPRDATESELAKARKIARVMIESYLQYLSANSMPH